MKKRWKNEKKEYFEKKKTQAAVIFSHLLLAYWYVCKSSCSVVDSSEKRTRPGLSLMMLEVRVNALKGELCIIYIF